MQTKAALMVLVLLSGTIAGCTSDPDGGGNDGIDSDALDDLFDQYFEDFVNNTTITVNNHYYNNTTYVVDDGDYSSSTTTNIEYNNTTNVDGGEINNYNTDNSVSNINGSGVGSASIMQMFTVNWAHTEVQIPNFGNRIVTLNDTLQQTSGNPNLLYALVYEGNLIEFEDVNCEQFYNFAWMSVDQWEDHLIGIYGYGSGDSYWPARDLRDFWSDNAYHDSSSNPVNAEGETVQDQCPGIDGGADESYYLVTVFEIELFTGEALEFLSLPDVNDIVLVCDDGFTSSMSNRSAGHYLGGQANCTVSGIAQIRASHYYDLVHWSEEQVSDDNSSGNSGNNGTNNSNSDNNGGSNIDTSNIPDWWVDYGGGYYDQLESWYFYGGTEGHTYSSTPNEFAVYFTTYFVEVYDEGSE